MNIELNCGYWITDNGYSISGSYDDKYIVWKTDDDEYRDILFDGDFEECITWCYNS